jgi:DNA-binding FrmR family transcriptional regulator
MSAQRHPDVTALAEYRAGLADGQRGRRLAAHVATCDRCAQVSDQLAAVSSALASAPAPAMPDSVERRIAAALASEAARSSEAAQPSEAAPIPSRPRRTGPAGRIHRLRPLVAVSAAAACLVLAGVVYLVGFAHFGTGPTSSSAAGSSVSSPFAGPAHAAAGQALPVNGPQAAFGGKVAFLVTASGTRYEQATLAGQVRAELAAKSASERLNPSKAAAASSAPQAALAACVLHLTGNAVPALVDRATYQGKPAYVIAVPDRAWVVGPDCTASNPDVIASTGL